MKFINSKFLPIFFSSLIAGFFVAISILAWNNPTATPPNGDSILYYANNNIGIGTTNPQSKLEVAGTIHSTTGGIKFPDGTIQVSTAASKFFTVYASVSPGLAYDTVTLIPMDTEVADADNIFNNSTYRAIIPNSETWDLEATVSVITTNEQSNIYVYLYKNGVEWRGMLLSTGGLAAGNAGNSLTVSGIATGNGTDYYSVYAYQAGAGGVAREIRTGLVFTKFEGHKI